MAGFSHLFELGLPLVCRELYYLLLHLIDTLSILVFVFSLMRRILGLSVSGPLKNLNMVLIFGSADNLY
jgi:hypothetical protein